MRTRIKICGITRVNDALNAVKAGADALGLVFYAASPRFVSISQAQEIVKNIQPFVCVVGLFVNATKDEINKVLSQVRIDLLQFHGDESPEFCQQFGVPFMKAIRVKHDTNLLQYANDYKTAQALLLDAHVEGVAGGTGLTFDWDLIPNSLPLPVVLAGGLTADNVENAIQQVSPYAVDVSGGVEVSKGVKDATKMEAFSIAVGRASLRN